MKFIDLLNEKFDIPKKVNFTKWVKPDAKNLKQEYNVEYKHHIKPSYGNIWPTYKDFEKAVKKGKVVNPNSLDIDGTTDFKSIDSLFSLIKSYRSYPEFRNEKTFQQIIDAYRDNKPMNMVLIIKQDSDYQIMSGNTRLNIANILKVKPKAIVIEV